MNRPWWQARDPDLGDDRPTKALGRRDWNWFTADPDAQAHADREPAQPPWAPHRFTTKDRHDRTLGIPHRRISMWPDHTPPNTTRVDKTARRARATQIVNDLHDLPAPKPPPAIGPDLLASLLAQAAPRLLDREPDEQTTTITAIARANSTDPDQVLKLARGVGQMIAQTTHRSAPGHRGDPRLNQLTGADHALAARIYLARAHLSYAAAYSDADLPRLWILANGLHHGVPAPVLLTQPARSHGPLARVQLLHHDLVGWHGIRDTLHQLHATVRAAAEGRRWLDTARDTPTNRLLALGILHLTHPALTHELTRHRANTLHLSDIRAAAHTLPVPHHPLDLSDHALKATCDRNNWLLGTTDEHRHRQLVEHHHPEVFTDHVRTRLAAGDTTTLAAAVAQLAPTDTELDHATYNHTPPALDTTQTRQLLDTCSRHALHHFAGLTLRPHPDKATALTTRYPDRAAHRGLRTHPHQLLPPPRPEPGLNLEPGL